MRVQLDWDLCIGSGLCVASTNGALQLADGPRGGKVILVDGALAPDDLLRAAHGCPTLAIRLRGDDGEALYPPDRSGSSASTAGSKNPDSSA